MPELPEVETIRRGLENLIGKKVKNIFRSEKKLRMASTLDLQELSGLAIKNIERKARYLILNFSKEKSLIIHLGMSGRITIERKNPHLKHDHFVMEFTDGLFMVFNDPRRFGFVDLVLTKNLKQHKMLTKLGIEPLCDDFNFSYLAQKLSRKKKNIKTIMMDNEIVVGVGNIYISEALFDAKISPLREASSIKISEIKNLVSAIKKTIGNAIELGGSSINDYVDSAGNLGNFQKTFKVYGRATEKCLLCKNLIKRFVQSGRSSFFCPSCQK